MVSVGLSISKFSSDSVDGVYTKDAVPPPRLSSELELDVCPSSSDLLDSSVLSLEYRLKSPKSRCSFSSGVNRNH